MHHLLQGLPPGAAHMMDSDEEEGESGEAGGVDRRCVGSLVYGEAGCAVWLAGPAAAVATAARSAENGQSHVTFLQSCTF